MLVSPAAWTAWGDLLMNRPKHRRTLLLIALISLAITTMVKAQTRPSIADLQSRIATLALFRSHRFFN